SVVGGAVVDRDGLVAGVAQGDREVVAGRADVALVVAHIVDADGRGGAVGGDGAYALRIGNRGVGGRVQVDEEGVGGLEGGVAVDQHRDRLAGDTAGEDQRAGRACGRAGRRGSVVGGAVVDRDGLVAGVAQGDREVVAGRADVALVVAHIVDAD